MTNLFSWFMALYAVLVVPSLAVAREDAVSRELRTLVSGSIAVPHTLSPEQVDAAKRFYTQRRNAPVWWTGNAWRDRAVLAQRVLAGAGQEGLRPRDYADGLLALPSAKAPARQIAEADVLLTAALLHYIADISNGRRKPHEIEPELHVTPTLVDPLTALHEGIEAADFAIWLRRLAPSTPGYSDLRDALARMRSLAAAQSWPRLPDGPKMEKGLRAAPIRIVRQHLALLGDLRHGAADGDYFDSELDLAVKAFQRRHGLDVDGIIGPDTRRALNLGPGERAKQIALNMERLRWLDEEFGPRYVLVNIAGFELTAIEGNKVVIRSPVVVGRAYRRTPAFSDQIVNLVLSPAWTAPPRLARLDILPKIKANPAYLAQQGFRVFDGWGADARELNPTTIDWRAIKADNLRFRFRQDPGPLNALGGVRFSLTNTFSIYLHDTPHKELFSKAKRSFSSGCIRVAKATELALFALDNDANWPPARLAEVMASAKTEIVKLAKPLPVHIIYRTAWVDEAGILQFRDDVYGRDALLRPALKLDESE